MKRIPAFLLSVLILWGCEKDIDFQLDATNQVLVVDASIENNQPPRVVLTKSFSYYQELNVNTLLNSFVRDAEVYISNGVATHRMKEYQNEIFPGVYSYYYGIDSSSLNTAFLGELNHGYDLKIISEGQTYESHTDIPNLNIIPDSIFFKAAPQNPDTTKRMMMIRINEPAGLGNYIRYFTKKNNEPFFPGPNSVYSDEVIDGSTVTVQLEPGINRNNPPALGENFYRIGDTVTLKYCNISRPTYLFWNTWEFSQQSIGNPFAQPNKVLGNISNGALGSFCGYGAWYQTYIVD